MKKAFWCLVALDLVLFVIFASLMSTGHMISGIVFISLLAISLLATWILFIVAYDEFSKTKKEKIDAEENDILSDLQTTSNPDEISIGDIYDVPKYGKGKVIKIEDNWVYFKFARKENYFSKNKVINDFKYIPTIEKTDANKPLKQTKPPVRAYDYLNQMGASWFVSFSYHIYVDEEHINYKRVKTVDERRNIFNDSTQYHIEWLKYISTSIYANKLSTNEIGLSGNRVKSMAAAVLNKRFMLQQQFNKQNNSGEQVGTANNDNIANETIIARLRTLHCGDKVSHISYGTGIVKKIDDEHITVGFDEVGEKIFQHPFAFQNGYLKIIEP